MQLSLFKNEPNVYSFGELDGLGFDGFKSNMNILNESFYDDVNPYYAIYAQRGVKPFYHLSLAYNTAMDDKQFRFVLIDMGDGDTVFVPYKVIQILKTKQIRFFNKPVSKNGNTEHEQTVYDKLMSLGFVKFVLTGIENPDKSGENLVNYNDWYFQLDDKDAKYGSSKFRSKNHIIFIFNNSDFDIRYTDTINAKQMLELHNIWKVGMINNGSTVAATNDKAFNNVIMSGNENLRYIVIYYKSVPISLQILNFAKEHGFCDCLYIQHIWNDGGDIILHKVLQSMTKIQKYLLWKYVWNREHTPRVYWSGFAPKETARMLPHKERNSDGKIEYYLI